MGLAHNLIRNQLYTTSESTTTSQSQQAVLEQTSQQAGGCCEGDLAVGLKHKNQPTGSYVFPKRYFGKSQPPRSFLPEWFKKFSWLHYEETTDSAFCSVCMNAVKQLHSSKRDESFITRGYTNWKHATSAFKKHEDSASHKQVISLSLLPHQCGDIAEIMSSKIREEKRVIKRCFCLNTFGLFQ